MRHGLAHVPRFRRAVNAVAVGGGRSTPRPTGLLGPGAMVKGRCVFTCLKCSFGL